MTDSPSDIPDPHPRSATRLYRMCWQLENWLRVIVYVELRAWLPDWKSVVNQKVAERASQSHENDKRQHHMATPHESMLSYLTFGQLWSVIDGNWPFFEPYFPPRENVKVRIDEVKAIRNRVAHFRELHPQDEKRLELFMVDMEQGIRKFCQRYTEGMFYPEEDPVWAQIESVWEQRTYATELRGPGGWLYAEDSRNPQLHGTLSVLFHGDRENAEGGILYALSFNKPVSDKARYLDLDVFFTETSALHGDIIHILFAESQDEVSVTIPALHGAEKTAEVVIAVLSAALNTSWHSYKRSPAESFQALPEYVIRPNHVLSYLTFYCSCKDIHHSILDLS